MSNSYRRSAGSAALLTLGVAASVIACWGTSAPVSAQVTAPSPTTTASFPDIQNHWARPFIERLAEKNIVTGYLDGTYRPNKAVNRDEFAAIIRQAFNQNQVRKIVTGSVYKDVPTGYWAAPAIEEAYQTGFMTGYPGGFFRPQEEVSRVQALVALTKVLNNSSNPTASSTTPATATPATSAPATTAPATTQSTAYPATKRRATKKRFLMPLAMTSLMYPIFMTKANAQSTPPSSTPSSVANDQDTPPSNTPSSVAKTPSTPLSSVPSSVTKTPIMSANPPASFLVSDYYADAKQIPLYAVDDVAAATRANIVVNYPNLNVLNPNQAASRGDVAAFIYQTLVNQGKIEPLRSNAPASNYIVGRTNTTSNNQTTQTAQ
ncbi:S-layer homology domain-containing protein [Coleofasciculus sp. FACHB-1120]|uniref:S-layer homology domain-containing protein n=1 Tax=Coleofasciculus sp. FACHB-1120 TaxID=2692783 RepID=UPI0016871A30|nr:S-layer homology domain-containing protein [Coleofasciculus sp. FACHB-1120]MBD2741077.1 S-layer homology domain-containing protein [Coleofasciculus sp. FACHB-1120]